MEKKNLGFEERMRGISTPRLQGSGEKGSKDNTSTGWGCSWALPLFVVDAVIDVITFS